MGAIEDHKTYGIKIRESADDGSDFPTPEADYRVLYLGEDGAMHLKDSAAAITDVGSEAGLAAHLADTADAHDASAISFTPNGSIAATDVQAAIQEVRDEAGGALDWGEDADITTQDYDDVADAGVLDEVARADHLHGMPSAGGGGATAFAGAKAYHSTTQGSLPAVTYNPLDLDSEEWDTDGFHSTSSNTSRMTIPAHLTGTRKYLLNARTYIAGKIVIPYFRKNGSTVLAGGGGEGNDQPADITQIVEGAPGDYFEFTPIHTAGTGVAGSATQDLRTEFSIVLLGGIDVAGLDAARARRTSGNLTLNSTSWANVDTGLDLVVPAQAGDVLLIPISALWGGEAVTGALDVATIVSGSPVNYVSGGGGGSDNGIAGLFGGDATVSGTLNLAAGAAVQYVVQAGDISGGTVTLRLRYRTGSASNKTLFATTALPLQWSVVNLRQGSAIGASGKVSRTSGDLTYTSATFADVTGMSITLSTGARRCLVTVSANVKHSTNTFSVALDIDIDGGRQGGSTWGLMRAQMWANNAEGNGSFSYLTDVLSAGSHTFKLQAATDGATGTLIASDPPLVFAVHEVV